MIVGSSEEDKSQFPRFAAFLFYFTRICSKAHEYNIVEKQRYTAEDKTGSRQTQGTGTMSDIELKTLSHMHQKFKFSSCPECTALYHWYNK